MTSVIKLNKFRFRSKIAAFDFDWTLVKPKENRTFPKNLDDWQWLRESVPKTLKSYYDKGYCLIIFSNQSKPWKIQQIENVIKTLELPFLIVVATEKENYKPNPQLFYNVIPPTKLDKTKSFFVGDALSRDTDFSDSDKVFAENIGIAIESPHSVFPYIYKKSETISPLTTQELVIMIGFPGSGKTTLINNIFGKNYNYVILSGDEFKTSKKMIKVAKPLLTQGQSVVIDATNPSKEKRKEYIDVAKELNISIRCIHIDTTMEEALHRNNTRAKEKIIPKIAYYKYRKMFEKPNADEGCTVVTI